MINNILLISGLDPSSGAGIGMDIRVAAKLNIHAVTIPSCLTAQNSNGFDSSFGVDCGFFKKQLEVSLEDVDVSFVKVGLLPGIEMIDCVYEALKRFCSDVPIIIDPIVISTTGKKLLTNRDVDLLKETLIAKSYLVTPNIDEVLALTGVEVNSLSDMKNAAIKLQDIGAKNVLIKGGHFVEDGSDEITHLLLKENGDEVFIKNKRIDTELEVRGTGCMLSTAITCFLSDGFEIEDAVQKADDFVNMSIKGARKIGSKLLMI
jgi:hydroxymethylpyrimidine/phosphomethylpyrimidine kinase